MGCQWGEGRRLGQAAGVGSVWLGLPERVGRGWVRGGLVGLGGLVVGFGVLWWV